MKIPDSRFQIPDFRFHILDFGFLVHRTTNRTANPRIILSLSFNLDSFFVLKMYNIYYKKIWPIPLNGGNRCRSAPERLLVLEKTISSLSNHDDDHNDNFKKTIGLMIKTTALHHVHHVSIKVHFFDVHCTTTTWNLLIWRFMEDVDIRRRIFLPLFEPE